jgi:hypothetical protein
MALSQTATVTIDTPSYSSPFTTYSCKKRQGALLSLPYEGVRYDVIRTKVFEDYIRVHVESWFSFAQRHGLSVQRMEDLILVSGCTLVTSWGVAAFQVVDSTLDAALAMRSRTHRVGGATFDWREIHPSVAYQNSQQGPVRFLGHITALFANSSFTVLKG